MPSYRFNDYELVTDARRLTRAGQDVGVGVRVFDVIAYLVEHRQRAVGRDELIAAVWGRVDGADALLAQSVVKARRAFGDDGQAQHHIRTVPRFGYQWVAPVEVAVVPAQPEIPGAEKENVIEPALAPARTAAPVRRWISRRSAAWSALVLIGLALAFFVLRRSDLTAHAPIASRAPATTARTAPVEPVPGLILVVPTVVQGAVPDDGWMRLGVMSLSAQALRNIPGHAVVPDDTALAAIAHASTPFDIERLRAATGATTVITSEANLIGREWVLSATVFGVGDNTQIVNARAIDPVAAAGGLARNLRAVLAPGDNSDEIADLPADVLALDARMKAAILDGQNGRALALFERAAPETAAAPSVILLHAEALVQLGRAGEAVSSLQALLDRAITEPPPRWLAAAWSALGDCELSLGHPALAESHFRHAIALLPAAGDHRVAGLAWRGLGIAQAVRNDLADAEASYLHARLELEPIGDRRVLARVTDGLGYVTAQSGRLADALLLYQQAAAMGAAFGANETELGSRLNIAQSHQYLLHHTQALAEFRALLPRLRGLDYPALRRFGLVGYASALADTGALTEARRQLALLDAESAKEKNPDAVTDVRLDEAEVRLAIGDVAGTIRQASAVRAGLREDSPSDRRLEVAALLLRAQTGRDALAARALIADSALWQPANALASARVHALVARARWHETEGDNKTAADEYAQAFAQARTFGAPVILRDAAVPYAAFQSSRGAPDAARATASVLGPYTEDDFECALLLAHLAVAGRDPTLARSWFAHARGLAGERWTATLAAEAAAAEKLPMPPPESANP